MMKTAFKYGLIIAAVIVAITLIPFLLQSPESRLQNMGWAETVGYAVMVAAFGLVFLALKEHRGHAGDLTFRAGLGLGLAITGIAAAIFGLATTGIYYSMGPQETDAFMRAYVESSGADLDQYEQNRHLWLNPWFQGFVMFATLAVIGAAVSLVAAWLMRDKS